MKKLIPITVIVAAGFVLYSCNKKEKDTLTTSSYLDLPGTNHVYFDNKGASPSFKDSVNSTATLGRVLFYDSHLSLNNAVSCASCHKQEIGFADNVAFSRGFEGRLTSRNSPGINGISANSLLFWDGRERVLENLIMRPISNHVEMGIDDLNTLPGKLEALSYYKPLFKAAFKDERITLERISKAVSCFIQSINASSSTKPMSSGSTFRPLTSLEKDGKALFDTVYNCGNCHAASNGYSGGGGFMDIGLDEVYTDKGLGAITGNKLDMGTFKIPNLTNVALTAPYMHDGRYRTLEEVLEHYSHGIGNSPNLTPLLRNRNPNVPDDAGTGVLRMNIKEADKKAIIAFLGSLTDYKTNTDEKFSNPFKVK